MCAMARPQRRLRDVLFGLGVVVLPRLCASTSDERLSIAGDEEAADLVEWEVEALQVSLLQRGLARSMDAGALASASQAPAHRGVGEDPLAQLGASRRPHSRPMHLGDAQSAYGERRGGPSSKPEERSWQAAKDKAHGVVAMMTAEEKLSFLHGLGWKANWTLKDGYYIGNTPALTRLRVPALKMQDASIGFRHAGGVPPGTVVAWPSMLALAATWDAGLVKEVAAAIAREFRGKGANVLLGPGVQVHRSAWGGRNWEYLSGEDPHLGAKLAAAYVKGAQGEGVMCVAKHWAFNEQEFDRNNYSVEVDDRTAWELYYPPFEAAVEAGVGAVMCAYNRVNGTHSCTNSNLLKRDLKVGMGFEGMVMSDWAATYAYSDAIDHGLDLDMPGDDGLWNLSSVKRLREGGEDEAVTRVLASVFKLGLEHGYSCAPPNCDLPMQSFRRTGENRELAAAAAAESVVLLKNDGVLPIGAPSGPRTIAVIGGASHYLSDLKNELYPDYYTGGGSGHVTPGSVVTPLDGIARRAAGAGVVVVSSATSDVAAGLRAARMADLVVVVAGTSASEMVDRTDLSLYDGADALIEAVAAEKKTVVLMQTPGAVLTPWRDHPNVSAIMNLFLAGEETGTAWAQVLFGDLSPAGKLPIMFPANVSDTIRPSATSPIVYKEGLFTSYRNPAFIAAFPFGHGLSYTQFQYGAPALKTAHECHASICFGLDITNVGGVRGSEVMQVYLEFLSAGALTPRRLLRAYRKVVLEPGKTESIAFELSLRDMSVYQPGAGWVKQVDARAHIGSSSADIRHVLDLSPSAR